MRRYHWAKIFFMIVFLAPLAIFLFGTVVMLLWNNVLVPVLHVSTVTFWQGLGILVLSKILFSSFGGGKRGPRGDHWKQRMMWKHMTPEQREKFKEEMRGRFWGNRGWRSETSADPVEP